VFSKFSPSDLHTGNPQCVQPKSTLQMLCTEANIFTVRTGDVMAS